MAKVLLTQPFWCAKKRWEGQSVREIQRLGWNYVIRVVKTSPPSTLPDWTLWFVNAASRLETNKNPFHTVAKSLKTPSVEVSVKPFVQNGQNIQRCKKFAVQKAVCFILFRIRRHIVYVTSILCRPGDIYHWCKWLSRKAAAAETATVVPEYCGHNYVPEKEAWTEAV